MIAEKKEGETHTPVYLHQWMCCSGMVGFFKGSRSLNISILVKVLVNFHRGVIESILIGDITNWHGRSQIRRLCMTKMAKKMIVTHFPNTSDIDKRRQQHSFRGTLKDSTHPRNSLFTMLPSGHRSIYCCTT